MLLQHMMSSEAVRRTRHTIMRSLTMEDDLPTNSPHIALGIIDWPTGLIGETCH